MSAAIFPEKPVGAALQYAAATILTVSKSPLSLNPLTNRETVYSRKILAGLFKYNRRGLISEAGYSFGRFRFAQH